MKAFRLILLLGFALFLAYEHYTAPPFGSVGSNPTTTASSDSAEADSRVPQKARQVLEIVRRTGEAPEGYVGGRVFQNREHRLPADGDYREFDVDPHQRGRNAERLVIEWRTKKAWYSDDHYRTFIPVP